MGKRRRRNGHKRAQCVTNRRGLPGRTATLWHMTTPRGGGRSNLHQIYDQLQGRIRAGEFDDDGKLPSTAQLANEYEISSPSVQKIIGRLRSAGVVTSRAGVGVFVTGAAQTAPHPSAPEVEAPAPPRMNLTRLVQDLELRIRAGDFDDDSRLPSMAALAQHYATTTETVRRALRQLEDRGLVKGQQGVGVFLVPRPVYPLLAHSQGGADQELAWRDAVSESGAEPQHIVTEVGLRTPPPAVAQQLDLGGEETAFLRRTLHLVDGRPVRLSDHWFPPALASGSALADPRPLASVSGALAQLGCAQVRHVDRVQSALPTAAEATLMRLETQTVPITRCVRAGFDQAGSVVRVSVTSARGDAEERVYELPG